MKVVYWPNVTGEGRGGGGGGTGISCLNTGIPYPSGHITFKQCRFNVYSTSRTLVLEAGSTLKRLFFNAVRLIWIC